ncbi:MAG TPA: DUF6600 domain-containing protein [Candidatus Polarisedimenticolia bacterium]|nr:DUF6600 domain-containing protein [Candidatus Polarisedimenticolia bacterium]
MVLRGILLLSLLVPLAALPAYSEEEYGDSYSGDVPARIRALEGDAVLQRQQEQDRVDATINSPVFTGDLLSTEDGRAEVEFPDGTVLWLDSDTQVEFLGMEDPESGSREATALRLHDGRIEIDYRGGGSGDPRIDTPESSVYIQGEGRFRVESDRGTTTLISLRGVAELAGDDGSMLVRDGMMSQVELGSAPDEARSYNTLRLDDFDAWCEERLASYLPEDEGDDREYVQAVPAPVRHYVTELDNYGDWEWMVSYGWVWRPASYTVGWRPYYNGYWTSCPRGWVWVAYEPWGWVPYHYGRWQWLSSAGWFWIPGGVFSGAWVSWAVTPSYIGWCPLDYYNRPAYVNVNINITNVTVNRFGGGWNFLPLNRLSDRGASRLIVKADRVPRLEGAVTTKVLPRFSPDRIGNRPDLAQRIYRESANGAHRIDLPEPGRRENLVPFRQLDRREAGRQHDSIRGRAPDRTGTEPRILRGGRQQAAPRPERVPNGRSASERVNPRGGREPGGDSGVVGRPGTERRGEGVRPERERGRPEPQGGGNDRERIRPRRESPDSAVPQDPSRRENGQDRKADPPPRLEPRPRRESGSQTGPGAERRRRPERREPSRPSTTEPRPQREPDSESATDGNRQRSFYRGPGMNDPRPRRESAPQRADRDAPNVYRSYGTDNRGGSRRGYEEGPGSISPRPRRERGAPSGYGDSRDASRRVLDGIFGEGARSRSRPAQPGATAREERVRPEGSPSRGERVQGPQQRSAPERIERSRPQGGRQAPPPRKQEEKKGRH